MHLNALAINLSSKSLKFDVLLLLLINEEREWRLQRWSVGLKYSKMNKAELQENMVHFWLKRGENTT